MKNHIVIENRIDVNSVCQIEVGFVSVIVDTDIIKK